MINQFNYVIYMFNRAINYVLCRLMCVLHGEIIRSKRWPHNHVACAGTGALRMIQRGPWMLEGGIVILRCALGSGALIQTWREHSTLLLLRFAQSSLITRFVIN